MEIKNLFAHISDSVPEEVIEVLPKTENFRLERIVSDGQATPPGEWYDQETHEWVLLLKGSAGLRLAGEPGIRVMRSGDALHIPEHLRHRVEWTEGGIKTIWLALPSDTPRRAGGLMNGAASKAVALFTQSWD